MENKDTEQKKPPRRSFLYYYGIVMLVLLLLNIFVFPPLMDRTVEVRYDQFLTSLNEGNIEEVYETTNEEVMYTLKDDEHRLVRKTGLPTGENLAERLEGTDVKFSPCIFCSDWPDYGPGYDEADGRAKCDDVWKV